ncbi:unnamed protein product [Durusdinium trenchii]|uniref:EF-hand domain-containing protein n=2 Tax=Durusdinium trenchii TaxID=1381693 RepID=A0ABP0M7C4_9DINO
MVNSLRSTTPLSHASLNATQAKGRQSILDKEHLRRALSVIEKDSFRYQNAEKQKPWMDAESWSILRVQMAKVVRSQTFETVMGLVIIVNLMLMVVETDADASCYPLFSENTKECPSRSSLIPWLQNANLALLMVYTIECACRAFVERSLYARNVWNLVDFCTMLAGWTGLILAPFVNLSVLRIVRVARLVRLGRLVISVPELYWLLSGLSSSFKAILFGSLMLMCVIVVWSIVVVEFLHPVNVQIQYDNSLCERCQRGFQNVYAASLTIFSQIVAGDQWGAISLPMAEHSPWTAPVIFVMMTTISLGVMNLILAVIVEKAAEAREKDSARKKEKKDQEREAHLVELAMLFDSMDENCNGKLSLEEMLNGFDCNPKFRQLMDFMDIAREEVEVVFNVLDGNASEEVDYLEFCKHLSTFRKRDPVMMQSMMKYSVMELRHLLKQDIMQVLQLQTQMLTDQLTLFRKIPECAEDAKELESKWASALTPGNKTEMVGPEDSERSREVRDSVMSFRQIDLDEVNDRLAATCMSFHTMQTELECLLERATLIPQGALAQASESVQHVKSVKSQGDRIDRPKFTTNRSLSSLQTHSSKKTGSDMDGELEDRFKDLLSDFREHMEKEAQLQGKCRETLESISSLMYHWSIVQNDL